MKDDAAAVAVVGGSFTVSAPRLFIQTPVPPTATIAASPTIVPTPTRQPANPATITTQSIWLSLGQGALVVLAAFTVFGLLLALSQKLRT